MESIFLAQNKVLSDQLLDGNITEAVSSCQALLDEMWSEYIKKSKTGKELDVSLIERFKAGEYKGIGPVDTAGAAYLVELADDKTKVFKYKKILTPYISFDMDRLEEAAQVKINNTVVCISDLRWVLLKDLGSRLAEILEKCIYPTYVFTTPKLFVKTEAYYVQLGVYMTLAEESRIELFHQYITEQKAQEITQAIQNKGNYIQAILDCFPQYKENFTPKFKDPV